MSLHAAHTASAVYRAVVITSKDTDVFVLSLAFKGFISCPMFVKRSQQTRTAYMDVSRIVQLLGSELCRSLPGLHAFTGCDSVSAFWERQGNSFEVISNPILRNRHGVEPHR